MSPPHQRTTERFDNMEKFFDRIEKKIAPLSAAVIAVAIVAAISILTGAGASIARADTGECVNTCADAPHLGDFTVPVSPNSPDMLGITQDRGRVTLTLWAGATRPVVVELGHIVNGIWVPYTVDVKFDRGNVPIEGLPYALIQPGAPQLVTVTTDDALPGEYVVARVYWQSRYFTGHREMFFPLAGAYAESPLV